MRDSYSLYEDKLQGAYKETFRTIDMYFGTTQVDEDTREEYMGGLLDIFLLAQEEGKPVEKITGKNLESFCKSFCSDLTWKQKLLKIADQLKGLAWFAFVTSALTLIFSVGDVAVGENVNFWKLTSAVNIWGYIQGFFIIILTSAITDFVTRHMMFRMKKVSMRIWQLIVGGIAIGTFLIFLVLYYSDSTFDFPAWLVCEISGIYLLFYYLLNQKRLRERKAHEVKFWEEVKKDADFHMNTQQAIAEELEKKWAKKNKKRIKRGLPELTRAEILNAEEAECLETENMKWGYTFLPIGIIVVLWLIFSVIIGMSFEKITDILWFYGILIVVEYVLMALLWKVARSGLVERRKWIETERGKLNMEEDVLSTIE